ncbi:MAG: hypothetical protein LC130_22280 [Bryobacterales bacterium]|nr:hypothetical protein [Bryobacterales bacterium]
MNAKAQAALRPFEHTVVVGPTGFHSMRGLDSDQRNEFLQLSKELTEDEGCNRMICEDVIRAVREPRSPLILTERNRHLDALAAMLSGRVRHLIVLRGGMGKKESEAVRERLAGIPCDEERVLLATGKYIGEGFDDPRLDTLFVTLPVCGAGLWRNTWAGSTGFTNQSARCGCMIMRISTFRCWRECSTGAAAGMKPSGYDHPARRSDFRMARGCASSRRSNMEARLCGERKEACPGRRRIVARDVVR